MTTTISTTVRQSRTTSTSHAASVALLASAAFFVATALVVLIGHPVGGTARLHSVADYLFTAMLLPIAVCVAAAAWAMHVSQAGLDARAGRVGVWFLIAGEFALFVDGVATLVSANPNVAGPLYPLAMLATLVGFVSMAVGAEHARVLPRWVLPALIAAWIFGGPFAVGGSSGGSAPWGFRGAGFVFAAVAVLVAVTLSRRPASAARG